MPYSQNTVSSQALSLTGTDRAVLTGQANVLSCVKGWLTIQEPSRSYFMIEMPVAGVSDFSIAILTFRRLERYLDKDPVDMSEAMLMRATYKQRRQIIHTRKRVRALILEVVSSL